MKHETITAFASRFGLSRSTLLYYDRIGLLKPSGHNAAGYRLYDEHDAARMKRIDTFRRAGIPLKAIQTILENKADDALEQALEQRLADLNDELARLRSQQELIVRLLKHRGEAPQHPNVSIEQWVRMLEEAGMDEDGRHRWHHAFERDAPAAHREFLKSLGLTEREIQEIRRLSKSSTRGENTK